MNPMLWTIVSLVGTWIGVVWAFVAVMHGKARMESGELTLFWKVHLLPLAAIGVVLDVAFNFTFGVVMFAELPRELMFSSRVQRHYNGGTTLRPSSPWQVALARFWGRQLNQMAEFHIRS